MLSGCDILFFRNDPVIARVRWRRLHTSEVNRVLGESFSSQSRDQFVEQWVNQQLWDIEAKKHVRLNPELRAMVDQYQSSLLIRQFQENHILNKIMIHESDVLEYYNEHRDEFTTHKPTAFVEIYTTPSLDAANDVFNSLKKTARPTIPAQLKLVQKDDCVDPVDKAIFSNNKRTVVGPIAYFNQYFIVSIIEYYPENSLLRVEHVRDDIIQKLQIIARSNTLLQKQKELKDNINVKIFKTSDR